MIIYIYIYTHVNTHVNRPGGQTGIDVHVECLGGGIRRLRVDMCDADMCLDMCVDVCHMQCSVDTLHGP